MDYITKGELRIPVVTIDQMREVDWLMAEKYGIQLIQMMENAGFGLAELSRQFLGGTVSDKKIAVVAGGGNNGGGGLTAARRLYTWGADVSVIALNKEFFGVPKTQWDILQNFTIKKIVGKHGIKALATDRYDLTIDALIGYGLKGNPHRPTADFIDLINSQKSKVISLDVPSGLNADSGEVQDPCVRADATLTLALPKIGLFQLGASPVVGELYLVDISVPRELYAEMGIKVGPLFSRNSLIKL